MRCRPSMGREKAAMKRYGVAAAVVVAPILMFGCAKQPATLATAAPAPTASAVSPRSNDPTSLQPTTNSGTGTPAGGRLSGASDPRPAPIEFAGVRDLVDVHFDFDKDAIRPRDAQILDANARWLRANADARVLIEGHCDERGTEEY